MSKIIAIASTLLLLAIGAANAQPVKIGVLTNQTGIGAASGGPGTVAAARMAVADFGPTVLGRPIQLTDADFAFKPDLAASIARPPLDRRRHRRHRRCRNVRRRAQHLRHDQGRPPNLPRHVPAHLRSHQHPLLAHHHPLGR